MWIGLCGQSGAGKSFTAALFAERGIPSIDTDSVYRDLTGPADPKTPCMEALCHAFGVNAASADGSLNRTYLRKQVFGEENKERLLMLNRITHRFILAETTERADAFLRNGAPFVLIDAPLLFESGFDQKCAAVICVTAPLDVRIKRIENRDGISASAAMERIRTQLSEDTLRERADYIICNDGSREMLEKQVDSVIASLKERFSVAYDNINELDTGHEI